MGAKAVLAVLFALVVLSSEAVAVRELGQHKYAVKTIRSEDGDIIDCVDKYKQPSLLNVPVANYTQVFQSGSHPGSSRRSTFKNDALSFQVWQRSGRCPPNTVPILRHPQLGSSLAINNDSKVDIERALVYGARNGPFHGASAEIESWSLHVMPNEYSMAAITLASASNGAAADFSELNFTDIIRAGVMVHPGYFGDGKTRFFVQWSNDGGRTTGCYNLHCKGFIQTSSKIALGSFLSRASVYNDPAKQYYISVDIQKDLKLPRWYLYVNGEEVGYWPIDTLFNGNFYNPPFVTWGGQILNTWPQGKHTPTQMGNGHEADVGPTRAAMFHMVAITDSYDRINGGYQPQILMDRPSCYSIDYLGRTPRGTHFTYGGYGGPMCTH